MAQQETFRRTKIPGGIAAFLGFIFVLTQPLLAEEEEPTSARVQEINLIVEKHTQELQDKLQKQKAIEDSFNKVKQEVKSVMQAQAQLKKDFETAKSQVDTLNKEIELTADHIESMERKYAARIRVLYMQRSEDFLENVFLISDQTTLKRNAFFMSRIRQTDQKIINDLFVLKKDRELKIQEMNKGIKQKADLNDKVSKQTKILNTKLAEQESILKDFNRQKAALELTIASLKAQSLRIETVITSLTGKEKREKDSPHNSGSIKQSLSPAKLEAFSGEGLEKLKGQLLLPVKGAEVKDSGKQSEGSTQVSKILGGKGILYSAEPGSDVYVVERGRVIFNSSMPGRGKMIIIDHGQRYYSLYGKLSDSEVEMGQEVAKGDIIAHTEEKPDGEAEFYFEIRKNGIAIDAKSFLKSR